MANEAAAAPDWHRYARLPDGEWISLRAVLSFAQWGWCDAAFKIGKVSPLALARLNSGLPHYRAGSLRAGESPAYAGEHSALTKFQNSMLEAARSGQLLFQGVKDGKSATERENIAPAFFAERCLFGEDGDSDIDREDGSGTWHEVAIERSGLLNWLRTDYPAIAKLHDEFCSRPNGAPSTSPDSRQNVRMTRSILSDLYAERANAEPRFYPDGHIPPHRAAVMLAKARHAARWQVSAMSETEWQLWHTEHRIAGGLLLGDWLRHEVKPWTAEASARWADFSEAIFAIRKALDAGKIIARFRHANGDWDHIKRTSWAIDEANDVLLSGTVSLEGIEQRTVVLIGIHDFGTAFPETMRADLEGKTQVNPPTTGASAPRGKTIGVLEAVDALWPAGIPAPLKSKGRNAQIRDWFKANGFGEVSDRLIVKALSRKVAR